MTNKGNRGLIGTQGTQGGHPEGGSYMQFARFDPRLFDNIQKPNPDGNLSKIE